MHDFHLLDEAKSFKAFSLTQKANFRTGAIQGIEDRLRLLICLPSCTDASHKSFDRIMGRHLSTLKTQGIKSLEPPT